MPVPIVGWPMAEARIFLRDLIEYATQSQFVYVHPVAIARPRHVGQSADHASRSAIQ